MSDNPQEKEYVLKLDANKLQYIFDVLGERPFKEVEQIMTTIRRQVEPQQVDK